MAEGTSSAELPPGAGAEPQFDLDREKLALEQRRLALEESWPRKWGSVLVGGAAAVTAALIGAGFNLVQLQANANAARVAAADRSAADGVAAAARKAEAAIADAHRNREDDRVALDMYFKYVAGKPADASGRLNEIKAIASIAHDRTFIEGLLPDIVSLAAKRPPEQTPSDALSGAPDLTQKSAGQAYQAGDFVGYVQYYETRGAASQTLTDALKAIGVSVPGQQRVDARHSPAGNEIRIYRADQREFAQQLGAQLQQRTGIRFTVTGPLSGKLPNGVMEFWLGRSE